MLSRPATALLFSLLGLSALFGACANQSQPQIANDPSVPTIVSEPDTSFVTTTAPATTTTAVTTTPVTTAALASAELGATAVCTLKGLPVAKAVQQFVYAQEGDTLVLYVTQREGQITYLTRCLVSADEATATAADYVKLEGYGHAESLDVSIRDGETYLYLGSGANAITNYAWATTITRLRYTAGSVSDIKTITGLEYASKTGARLGANYTPYRINFAADNDADLFILYLRLDTNYTGKQAGQYLVAYRLSALDQLLDAAESGISLADASGAYLASSGKSTLEDICYNTSFQGLEVDAEGNIYIIGGTTAIQPQLSRFAAEDGVIRRKRVTTIHWLTSSLLGDRNFDTTSTYVEIEAIKYFDGNLYCSFNPTGAAIPDCTEIFLLEEK